MTSVFLYIPNIIGYFRIITLLTFYFIFECCPVTALIFYGISAGLDALDGKAARYYNQCSEFGAILD